MRLSPQKESETKKKHAKLPNMNFMKCMNDSSLINKHIFSSETNKSSKSTVNETF